MIFRVTVCLRVCVLTMLENMIYRPGISQCNLIEKFFIRLMVIVINNQQKNTTTKKHRTQQNEFTMTGIWVWILYFMPAQKSEWV